MAHTSCSNLSNFCCNSRKYRDVMRPWWDLSKQSRASSVIWWWVKLRTPSARGRMFSGEWFVIMSWSLSSIWAVAYRKVVVQHIKSALHETNSLESYFCRTFLYCLRIYLAGMHEMTEAKRQAHKGKVTDDISPRYQYRKATAYCSAT